MQKILQPELDRQHKVQVRRRTVYRWGGLLLVVSAGVFVVWCRWFLPAQRLPRRIQSKSAARAPAAPLIQITPSGPPAALDLGPVEEILQSTGRKPEAVISILQSIQSRYRYLPNEALKKVCEASAITPARIAGVSTFYGQFRHRPVGEHIIRVCEGTACHVAGAVEVKNELCRCLGIKDGSDTDPSGRFTIERVACVGSCSLAPVVTIDEEVYGRVSPLTAGGMIGNFLRTLRQRAAGNGQRQRETSACSPSTRPAAIAAWPARSRCGSASAHAASRAARARCSRPSGNPPFAGRRRRGEGRGLQRTLPRRAARRGRRERPPHALRERHPGGRQKNRPAARQTARRVEDRS